MVKKASFMRINQANVGLIMILLWSITAVASPKQSVVVIPGILGSVLAEDGKVVWGDRLSLMRLKRLEIPNGPRDPSDKLEPMGLIQAIQIFGPLKIKQYDGLRSIFLELGYTPGIDYFEFAYDWRQSNFTTAEKFREWVSVSLKDREFDIVAHSMGGLIAEIFIKRHDTSNQVRRLITLGTPFLGSANAVAMPNQGWGKLPSILAGGIDDIRRIVLSIPAIYELLPTYPRCCIVGRPEQSDRRPFNIVSPEGWAQIDWQLPDALNTRDRRRQVAHTLSRAAELSRIVLEALPNHLQGNTYRIAGDLIETPGQFYVDRMNGRIVHWNNFLGDGTVLVRSAAKDEVNRAYVSLTEHQVIFDDESVGTTLKRILCPERYGPSDYTSSIQNAVTPDGDLVKVRSIGLDVKPAVLFVNDEIAVRVRLTTNISQPAEKLIVRIHLYGNDGCRSEVPVKLAELKRGIDSSQVTFIGRGTVSEALGPLRVVTKIPGLDIIEDFAVVLPRRSEQ